MIELQSVFGTGTSLLNVSRQCELSRSSKWVESKYDVDNVRRYVWRIKCFIWLHSGKITCNLKITQLKRNIIFQTSIFGVPAVNFPGCSEVCALWVSVVRVVFRVKLLHWLQPSMTSSQSLATSSELLVGKWLFYQGKTPFVCSDSFYPKHSMYGIFTYIYHNSKPNVCKYIPYMDDMGYMCSEPLIKRSKDV